MPLTTPHEDTLRAVFESAIDGILVIDTRGVIQMANAASADLFGYSESELLGRNVSALMGAEHASRHDGYVERYLRTGVARIIGIGREVEGRKRDGTMFPFRLSVGELTLPNQTLFTGIVHDRSAEHAYEAELAKFAKQLETRVEERTLELEDALARLRDEVADRRRAEALAEERGATARRALERERELGELKTRFVSLASHEFRTPLSTILSSAELIARYTATEQQDRRDRHIKRIRDTVVHLTDILNDFLSVGRMDEGQVGASLELVNVPALLRSFVEYITPVLRPGQRIDLAVSGGATAVTDPRLLRNILNNLVSNASKYSAPGDVIYVSADVDPERLRLGVRDTGIGIPPDEQGQLFERFFRATNADDFQGTGLGLHIVARYLDLLGGDIAFESVVGEGSTFTATVPNATAERVRKA